MSESRVFSCEFCGTSRVTTDKRKRFCDKSCADRGRNRRLAPGKGITREKIEDLKDFRKLDDDSKKEVLLGDTGFSVVCFDIEASHLKPNIGRILCCSFKPIGQEPYTFSALDRRFKDRDVFNDGKLANAIITELEQYDILVGWNSKNFDVKFINARALRVGGRAKRAQYHIDGMWSWRSKVSAWSKLDTANRFLAPTSVVQKTSVEWEKWMRVLGWDKTLRDEAMSDIITHCELDVIVLENTYRTLVQAGMVRSLRRDGGVL